MSGRRKEIPFSPDVGECRLEPSLVILAGPFLSGKTTTAAALARSSNLVGLDGDEYRRKIVLTLGGNPSVRYEMEDEVRIQTFAYRSMHGDAGKLVLKGGAVVLSASYSQEHYGEDLRTLIDTTGVPLRVFMLSCPEQEIPVRLGSRIAEGESASTVRDVNEFLRQRARYHEMTTFPFKRITTNRPLRDVVSEIMHHLKDLRKKP